MFFVHAIKTTFLCVNFHILLPGLVLIVFSFSATPALAATFIVNTPDDRGGDSYAADHICDTSYHPAVPPSTPAVRANGICTLRAAIEQANATAGPDIIKIKSSIRVLHPRSQLPAITDSATIVPATTAKVSLNGFSASGAFVTGLIIMANDSRVQGLIIENFSGNGISIINGQRNVLRDLHIGTKQVLTPAGATFRNGGSGIALSNSSNNTIGGTAARHRNVISDNSEYGIIMSGGSSTNVIYNNLIGTNIAGTEDLGNTKSGIFITGGSNGNIIGDINPRAGNVISGNNVDGIVIQNSNDTVILHNMIGTNEAGNIARGNTRMGIFIENGNNTQIGHSTIQSARNVVSGNGSRGIQIQNSDGCTIRGNFIGVDYGGRARLGNTQDGIFLANMKNCTVGGPTFSERNVISANGGDGLSIGGATTDNITVIGNHIGVNTVADGPLGNGDNGIFISNAPNITIGGTSAAERNIISANVDDGIHIQRVQSKNNKVEGNYIGTDGTGKLDFGNGDDGVFITNAPNNFIGGANETAGNLLRRNVISGNDDDGVEIDGVEAKENKVQGNYIGLKFNGTEKLGNTGAGVLVNDGQKNLVGGKNDLANGIFYRNTISKNEVGVQLQGVNGKLNMVQGNYIGTDHTGNMDLGNTNDGVRISRTADNTIGGTTTGERNIISGNDDDGVHIQRTQSAINKIFGNTIGLNQDGTAPLPNEDDGVLVINGAYKNRIGGTAAGEGNIIARNKGKGVVISSGEKNIISSNSIYSNDELEIDLGNNGVTPNDIGDPDPGPNKLQNFPYVTSDTTGGTEIDGIIRNGNPRDKIRVEIFSSPNNTRDPSHYGGGKKFLGAKQPVKINAQGNAAFSFKRVPVAAGHFITATATKIDNPAAITGNTSEFSCIGGILDVDVDSDNTNGDAGSHYGPQGNAVEDDIEHVVAAPPRPGRVVTVNNNDNDDDGILDYFDGFNADGAALVFGVAADDDVNGDEVDFVRLAIKVSNPAVLTINSQIRITYEASDPNPPAVIVGPPLGLAPGRMRLWMQKGAIARNSAAYNGTPAGDYVAPGVYKASAFNLHTPRPKSIFIEGVRASPSMGKDTILVELDLDGDGKYDCADIVSITVVALDLDVDSNYDTNVNARDEATELTRGTIVVRDHDGVYADPNQAARRKPLIIRRVQPANFNGSVIISRTSANLRVFTAQNGGNEITFNGVDNVFPQAADRTLWIQGGAAVSVAQADQTISLGVVNGPKTSDKVGVTVMWVGIDQRGSNPPNAAAIDAGGVNGHTSAVPIYSGAAHLRGFLGAVADVANPLQARARIELVGVISPSNLNFGVPVPRQPLNDTPAPGLSTVDVGYIWNRRATARWYRDGNAQPLAFPTPGFLLPSVPTNRPDNSFFGNQDVTPNPDATGRSVIVDVDQPDGLISPGINRDTLRANFTQWVTLTLADGANFIVAAANAERSSLRVNWAARLNITRNNNGTPANPADDTFNFVGTGPADLPNDGAGDNELLLNQHTNLTLDLGPPTVIAVVPNIGRVGANVNVTITGTNFDPAATVVFAGPGVIVVTNVIQVNTTTITANLNLAGAFPGPWIAIVTNPNGQSGVMPGGFTVNH